MQKRNQFGQLLGNPVENWTARQKPEKALITGNYCILEPIDIQKHAFNDYGYRRCEWKCNDLNEASKKAAKRFGFTFEGIFRQSYVYKNLNPIPHGIQLLIMNGQY